MEKKTTRIPSVMVDVKDMYQLLISECRYGYTRNNHLMPESAFDHVKKYLPKMFKKDTETTIRTAIQLCEECISELEFRFYNGNDDEFNTRLSYIKFIEWLLTFLKSNDKYFNEKQIYNIDNYYRNLSEDDRKKFYVYDADTDELLSKELLSSKEYVDFILNQVKKDKVYFRILKESESSKIYSILDDKDMYSIKRRFLVVNTD